MTPANEQPCPAIKINFVGEVEQLEQARSRVRRSGDVAIVHRGIPRWLVLHCPCGCGDEILLNLDQRVGGAWKFYTGSLGLTVFPSVWREAGCCSHFVIWQDKIIFISDDSL